MQNKYIRLAIFILYSWGIFQTYIIIIMLAVYFRDTECFSPGSIMDILSILFFFIPVIITIIQAFPGYIHRVLELLPIFIFLILMSIIVCGMFAIWWQKQTILRAWALATLGLCMGPGLALFIRPIGDGGAGTKTIVAFIALYLFYPLLYVANFLQKKYWPDNKLCNRIRFILKWPCLRT